MIGPIKPGQMSPSPCFHPESERNRLDHQLGTRNPGFFLRFLLVANTRRFSTESRLAYRDKLPDPAQGGLAQEGLAQARRRRKRNDG
jgi:hypothetical protein